MRHLRTLALLGALACGDTVEERYAVCPVTLTLDVTEAAPGDVVRAVGGPLSTRADTRVQVGGVQASVTDVTRTDCEACDACRDELGCLSCGACAGCDDDCAACTQSVGFEVPTEPTVAGDVSVQVINRHGTSDALPLQVTAPSPPPDTDGDTDPDTDG